MTHNPIDTLKSPPYLDSLVGYGVDGEINVVNLVTRQVWILLSTRTSKPSGCLCIHTLINKFKIFGPKKKNDVRHRVELLKGSEEIKYGGMFTLIKTSVVA